MTRMDTPAWWHSPSADGLPVLRITQKKFLINGLRIKEVAESNFGKALISLLSAVI